MVRKRFVLNKKVIDVFHKNVYIITIDTFHFILLMLGFLIQ